MMNWTRMADGSYYAVGQSYGTRVGYTVRRAHNNRTLWVLYVDGVYQQAANSDGCTFCGVKARAAAHHYARVSALMAEQKGRPLIDILN